MSAILNISVDLLAYEPDLVDGARVVGNIYPAGGKGSARRDVVFPCGAAVQPIPYEVEPGHYVVSATLPSGVVLTEDAEAREGMETPVTLNATDSPHETHSWQYLMGNIEPREVYQDRSTIPVPRSIGSRFVGGRVAPGTLGRISPSVTVTWIGNARQESYSFESMLTLATEKRGTPIARMIADPDSPLYVVPAPSQTDGTSHLYRFGRYGPVDRPIDIRGQRQYLLVEVDDAAHLVTLPAPWGDSQVEVLVNGRQSPTGSPIAVTVRDPKVGAGLAYLSGGALQAARTLFDDVEEMLYLKMENPLAAAAGAYVLIGTDPTTERTRWDPWLDNLRNWFDWMSDGAVLHAVRRLRRARTPGDFAKARDGLIAGFDRGVPVYTLGLSWLMDGLSEFPDDPACVRRLEQVRRLSWYVDMREPFVIVDLRRAR